MREINLWECLTTAEIHARRHDLSKPTGEDIRALENSARWNGQEISVTPTEDGWLIKVFSCYGEDRSDDIEILIPKQGSVRVYQGS